MNRILLTSAAAFALLLFGAPAQAQDLAAALEARDPRALAAVAAQDASQEQAALAQAMLDALHRQDHAAIAGLTAAASGALAPQLRLQAWQALAGVYLRQGRFAEAVAALDSAAALGLAQDAAIAAANAQARVFAAALAGQPVMGAHVAAEGRVALTRDMAQLARARVTINGAAQDAVLDTGAAYSTIAHATAVRLGLRFLDADVTVGSATSDAVASRLAIAERLAIAGGAFTDVVFIVLPDEALTFAGGAYTIEAIIGLPVLIQLGRLEFAAAGDGEVLRHRRSSQHPSDASNLALDGLQPIAFVEASGARLRMVLDSGARTSSLTREAAETFPALVAEAETRAATVGGAGGMVTEQDALLIPSLTLRVLDAPATLTNVRVMRAGARTGHGLIGQDVLRAQGGYVLDFEAMRFELLPAR